VDSEGGCSLRRYLAHCAGRCAGIQTRARRRDLRESRQKRPIRDAPSSPTWLPARRRAPNLRTPAHARSNHGRLLRLTSRAVAVCRSGPRVAFDTPKPRATSDRVSVDRRELWQCAQTRQENMVQTRGARAGLELDASGAQDARARDGATSAAAFRRIGSGTGRGLQRELLSQRRPRPEAFKEACAIESELP
jgi:hypothetical protein